MHEKQVETLVGNLSKAKAIFMRARASKTPRAMQDWMTNSLLPYLKKQVATTEGQYRKCLVILLNSSQSFYEGLGQGSADLDDAFEVGKDFKKAIALIEFEKDLADKKLSTDQKKVDQDIGRDGLFTMTQESKPTIMKYSIYADDLPRSLNSTLFTIKRMPVIPVTDPPLNFDKLKKARLAKDHIAFYPILINQPVLGLNQDWVQGEFKGKMDVAAAYVLDSIKTKFGKTHLIMGRANHIGNVSWLWIPSDKELGLLQKVSSSGRLAIKKWGFAFNV